MKTAAVSTSTARKQQPQSLSAVLLDLWRVISADLFNSYRPEKHYMRGPGPKWRERHARGEVLDPAMITLDDYYAAH